ncbi:MAG: hypothetical protein WAW88_16120 [Nocardioides sp.]
MLIPRALRAGRGILGALAMALIVTGCGAGATPEQIGPQGIDGLIVPNPSPDPDGFSRQPDSPWLGGTTGTVASTGGIPLSFSRLATTKVAGITTVPVELLADGGRSGRLVSWYAVDRAGNVWLFAEQSSGIFGDRDWRAGEGGARPGVAVPANPRRGDGFLSEKVPGGPHDRRSTLRVAKTDPDYAETCPGCVEFEITTSLGHRLRATYQQGAGLIRLDPLGGWPEV